MLYRVCVLCGVSLLLAGCNTMTVRESVLSTNQRVAMVSNPGDGVTPPTNVVLLESRPGQYSPVAAGFAAAPVTSLLAGTGAGIATGLGTYGAGRAIRPARINVGAQATGGSAAGGSGTGGSVVVNP